jgi:hypothetical protein
VLPHCCQFKSLNFHDLDFEKFIVSSRTLQQEKLNDEFGASCMNSGFSKSSIYLGKILKYRAAVGRVCMLEVLGDIPTMS